MAKSKKKLTSKTKIYDKDFSELRKEAKSRAKSKVKPGAKGK